MVCVTKRALLEAVPLLASRDDLILSLRVEPNLSIPTRPHLLKVLPPSCSTLGGPKLLAQES